MFKKSEKKEMNGSKNIIPKRRMKQEQTSSREKIHTAVKAEFIKA